MSKYKDLSSLTVDDLLNLFITHATEHAFLDAAFWSRDPLFNLPASTAAARRVQAVYSELRRRGRDAQMRLLDFLNHPDSGAHGFVETFALEFAPEVGVPAYEATVAKGGTTGMQAEWSLKALREGTLKAQPDVRYRSLPTVAEADRWPPLSPQEAYAIATGPSHLDADLPELAEAFRKAPIENRRHLAVRATEIAIAETAPNGTPEDLLNIEDAEYALRFEKLPAQVEHACMKTLASRLEEDAARRSEAQRSGDPDPRNGYAEHVRAGAHAISSLAIALTGDAMRLDEVVHEAIAACEEHGMDDTALSMLKLLRGDPPKPRPAKNPFGT